MLFKISKDLPFQDWYPIISPFLQNITIHKLNTLNLLIAPILAPIHTLKFQVAINKTSASFNYNISCPIKSNVRPKQLCLTLAFHHPYFTHTPYFY